MAGIANKAAFTKKCSCQNPDWRVDDIEVSKNYEITYKMDCMNCRAFWGSKSFEYRKYWKDKMDKVPVIWRGYSYDGNLTVAELFSEIDDKREEILQFDIASTKRQIAELQKELTSREKKLEKYRENRKRS